MGAMLPDTGRVRLLLQQAQDSLDAGISCVHEDPDAAMDDLLAARLLVATVLLAIQQSNLFA
jgi:hypothetical protein